MKKIIVMTVAAVSITAFGAPSWSALYTGAYDEDDSPSTENRANYSAYYCTVASAKTMFNGADTVSSIETYLNNNFAKGKSAMGETAGSYALTQGDYGIDQYSFVSHFADQIVAGDYFAVVFYQDDAFRVFKSSDIESGNLTFDDQLAATTAGSWQTVPEPTSGLMLLIGVAGLALKRKRA